MYIVSKVALYYLVVDKISQIHERSRRKRFQDWISDLKHRPWTEDSLLLVRDSEARELWF